MKSMSVLFPLALAAAGTSAATAQNPADPPIQVWLDQDGEFDQGDTGRVWVHAARDGFLLILHADGDGRVRVLFPLDPIEDDFVRGGVALEVRGRGDTNALYIDERSGEGLVLAAWSADPFRFSSYVRGDHWDFRALAADGSRHDVEAGLLDIVYRMADGRPFDYSTAPYIVGRTYARTGLTSSVSYANITYSSAKPWCYNCYDDWRFGFGFGWNVGFHSGFSLHIGLGSPGFYGPVAYDPFYHPVWYRPVYYDPFRYHHHRPIWSRGVWAWNPWYWDPYWYRPGPHYRYAGIGIHSRRDRCWGDPYCFRDPYRGRSGYATGIALGSGWNEPEPPRRGGFVTPDGYTRGRDQQGSNNVRVIGLSEEIGRSSAVARRTAARAGDDRSAISTTEPMRARTPSDIGRRAVSSAVASDPDGSTTRSTRALREAVQSSPPQQRSAATTNRLREAVQASPPQQRSATTTNRLREAVQSSPPQQRSSQSTNRLREAVQSSPPQQRSSQSTSRLREAVQASPPQQRSSQSTSRLREAVQASPPQQRSSGARSATKIIVPDRSGSDNARASVRSVPDRSDRGTTRAPTRAQPERSGITRAVPPARSSGSNSTTRSRSVPITRSGPPASSRSGAVRSGGASSSRSGAVRSGGASSSRSGAVRSGGASSSRSGSARASGASSSRGSASARAGSRRGGGG